MKMEKVSNLHVKNRDGKKEGKRCSFVMLMKAILNRC